MNNYYKSMIYDVHTFISVHADIVIFERLEHALQLRHLQRWIHSS